ncbi:MAG: hypothetical protein ACI9LV_000874 [Candidatus Nanohaloarchaea archaeon]|jgi:hypothetical protein
MSVNKKFFGENENNEDRKVRVPELEEVSEEGYHNYGSAYKPEFRESVNRISELFFEDRIESIEIDGEEYDFNSGDYRSDLEDLVNEMEERYDSVRYTETDDTGGELSIDFYNVRAFYDENSKKSNNDGDISERKSRFISEPEDWDFLGGQSADQRIIRTPTPNSSVRVEYEDSGA